MLHWMEKMMIRINTYWLRTLWVTYVYIYYFYICNQTKHKRWQIPEYQTICINTFTNYEKWFKTSFSVILAEHLFRTVVEVRQQFDHFN